MMRQPPIAQPVAPRATPVAYGRRPDSQRAATFDGELLDSATAARIRAINAEAAAR